MACCHMALVFAVMHLYNNLDFLLLLSIPFSHLFKSGIDKSMEGSTIPASPNLKCIDRWKGPQYHYQCLLTLSAFLAGANTKASKGSHSSKALCLMFACVFCISLCQD